MMRARSSVLLFTAVAAVATSAAVLTAQQRLDPLFPGQRAPKAPSLSPMQPSQAPQSPQATPPPPTRVVTSDTNPLANLRPRVVCGMTLIPAPPGVAPKIADQREAEKPRNPTAYTIRPVQPSICW